MSYYAALVLGVACAALGGELFVRSVIGCAARMRIAPGIVGATVAAFATSSPELSVSLNAALAGEPQIALGDALGGNVVNATVILGLALAISGPGVVEFGIKRDFPLALLAPVACGVLLLDGELSRLDGAFMLAIFCGWLAAVIVQARRQRGTAEGTPGKRQTRRLTLSFIAGLILLLVASRLIVQGAVGIANTIGVDEFVIGATIVAVSTSVPELATTVVARIRGQDEVGLATILGSNIFNGTFIVGLAAIVHPIPVVWHEAVIALAFACVAIGCGCLMRTRAVAGWRSSLLAGLYIAYLLVITG